MLPAASVCLRGSQRVVRGVIRCSWVPPGCCRHGGYAHGERTERFEPQHEVSHSTRLSSHTDEPSDGDRGLMSSSGSREAAPPLGAAHGTATVRSCR
jgi:hypothetical protein